MHGNHIRIMRSVLDEGKNVCVALRATPKDKDNPYSIEQRCRMFQKEFGEEITNRRVAICVIPDIEEICFGRKVGWGLRKIVFEDEEPISGTKIREKLRSEKKL